MADNTETLLNAELLYKGHVIDLYKETVRLPDGRESIRDIVRHKGAVAIVPIDDEGRVVLVRQYRQAARRALLEIPAGGLEIGEDPDACAARELQEEIGYKPGQIEKIGGVFLAPGYSTEFIHFYLARGLIASKLQQDDDEFLDIVPTTLDEAMQMIATGEICDAKTVSALLIYKTRYQP